MQLMNSTLLNRRLKITTTTFVIISQISKHSLINYYYSISTIVNDLVDLNFSHNNICNKFNLNEKKYIVVQVNTK